MVSQIHTWFHIFWSCDKCHWKTLVFYFFVFFILTPTLWPLQSDSFFFSRHYIDPWGSVRSGETILQLVRRTYCSLVGRPRHHLIVKWLASQNYERSRGSSSGESIFASKALCWEFFARVTLENTLKRCVRLTAALRIFTLRERPKYTLRELIIRYLKTVSIWIHCLWSYPLWCSLVRNTSVNSDIAYHGGAKNVCLHSCL